MGRRFEEIDRVHTPMGMLSLRRRWLAALDRDVYEIILGEEHLMSSAFIASEVALAEQGLAAARGEELDVVIGGLGLGYTASAALSNNRVASVTVVEALAPVIGWHRDGLIPLDPPLSTDPRCRLVHGDFFQMTREDGYDPAAPGRKYHAILTDIDHSPEALLSERHRGFYQPDGLAQIARHLHPGGIFGLWSDAQPDDAFTARLRGAFAEAWASPVSFHNPLQDKPFTQTVYLARA